MTESVRIGNAQAFWGDRSNAAAEMLAREPDLDYLTLDYLAEVSMSILAMQRERDSAAGFARDFVDVVRSLVPYWSSGGRCRLIANAGGLNPHGCAEACKAALEDAGCRSLRIGIVTGDDVLEIVRGFESHPLPPGEGRGDGDSQQRKAPSPCPLQRGEGSDTASSPEFIDLDTGAAIGQVRDRLVTANAYLGAAPIVEALAAGADIVITGRVADPSLVVAAVMHHFGWRDNDLDRLAGATVAGHLIECGTQVTGGISTDWLDVSDAAHIGFPIVEVAEDGSCVVTKPHGTGGRVTEMTVKEQLLYEIGDPDCYFSPDVTASFLSLAVKDLGNDRVQVSGASGKPRPEKFKVSATFRDGYRSAGTLTIFGRDAESKVRRCGEMVLQRVREAGFELRDSIIECLGSSGGNAGIIHPGNSESDRFATIVLRVAIETESHDAAQYFSRELMPLITAGPQGTTGYAEGRPRVHPVFRYWPCLISRDAVASHVEMLTSEKTTSTTSEPSPFGVTRDSPRRDESALSSADIALPQPSPEGSGSCLFDIACARSGDKGSSANVGVIARGSEGWEFLRTWLSANRVANFFSHLGIESVERFELPNLRALNFVLHGALRRSLRTDAQGKAFGQLLLEIKLPEDATRRFTASKL